MIQFSLTLSANQIAILRAVRHDTDSPPAQDWGYSWGKISNFVAGVRLLLNENLIEQVERDIPSVSPDRDGRYKPAKTWGITHKGRLALQLVKYDLHEAAQSIGKALPYAVEKEERQIAELIERNPPVEAPMPDIELIEPKGD